MLLVNDHTASVSPDVPSPEAMVAVNDEATGILLDAVSHSPLWKSTLVIVTPRRAAPSGVVGRPRRRRRAPGLDAQVRRYMRGEPATTVTPAMQAQIAESLRHHGDED